MTKNSIIEPTGSPLDLENKEHCSVVLTTDTMQIKVEGKFRQRERKLFVLLIHSVWNQIGIQRQYTVEVEKIKQVFREVTGVKGFNNWIWEYLENLAEIKITFENERYRGTTRLLSYVKADRDTGDVIFEIPSEIEKGIKFPAQYARLDTYFLIGLKGKYSVSLYQLLESKINLSKLDPQKNKHKEARFIEIDLEQLRGWLNINHGEYQDWYNFNKRVLQPAVLEINSNPLASTFTVHTEEIRGARKKVKGIKFFLNKTQKRLEREAEIQVAKRQKKPNYLDKTLDKYSQSIPITEVYELVSKYAPGHDQTSIYQQWRNKAANSKQYQNKGSFVNYCKNVGPHKDRVRGFIGSFLDKFAGNE